MSIVQYFQQMVLFLIHYYSTGLTNGGINCVQCEVKNIYVNKLGSVLVLAFT